MAAVIKKKSKGLGRGLDALLGDSLGEDLIRTEDSNRIEEVELSSLVPGKYQPRRVACGVGRLDPGRGRVEPDSRAPRGRSAL